MKKIVSLFVTAVCSSVYADSYFVQQASGTASQQARDTFTELIRSYIPETGNDVVNDPVEADFILQPKSLALGTGYVLTIEKRRKDKSIFSSQLRATRIEEFDSITRRLVRSVVGEKAAASDVRVSEVSEEEETKGTRRRQTVNRFYFGFGSRLFSKSQCRWDKF